MIATLLDKIGSLFDKDFLFGSFLPSLLFFAMIVGSLAMVVGLDETWSWLQWLSSLEQLALATSASVVVVVFAYVLNSLRPVLLRVWCGKSTNWCYWPMYHLGERYWRWQYDKLDLTIESKPVWAEIEAHRRKQIAAVLANASAPASICTPYVIVKLMGEVRRLHAYPTERAARTLINDLADAYSKFQEDSLVSVYHAISKEFRALQDREDQRRKSAMAARMNEFGPPESIRATSLGNLIEGFQHYAMRRYRMEAEIFWPRLLKVVDEKYLATAEDPRIIMEFSITLATLLIWYALLALFLGPWLWFNFYVWGILASLSLVGSVFFYGRALTAAKQYSQFNAACFDLFRLNLHDALHAPSPASWAEERASWETISQLIVFGDTSRQDFPLHMPQVKKGAQQ